MQNLVFDSEFFNITDTLECGQVFRFTPYKKGYKVFSSDKCAYVYTENAQTVIRCNDGDSEYFTNYFDTLRDYSQIYNSALSHGISVLVTSAKLGKGIRILNQNPTEALFSFIVSQNNNIPRIKGIIEKLCANLGDKKSFDGEEYFAFPTTKKMASVPLEFYQSIGLGYRAEYIKRLADDIENKKILIDELSKLDPENLAIALISIHGVGPKVCDCVTLFGFHKSDSFPVDTWIEKVYREDFFGKQTDRAKISKELKDKFGQNAGYFQQYLFYYKRTLIKK